MSRWILGLGLLGMASWMAYDRRRRQRVARAKKRQDELLDEALMESFPASDPPALTVPYR